MKTIKNMWAIDKALTVFTLVMAVVLLLGLGVAWWAPVNFGYPWYSVMANIVVTVFMAYITRSTVRNINNV